MTTPTDVYALISGAYEYVLLGDQRDFADIMKMTDLEMGRFWISPI